MRRLLSALILLLAGLSPAMAQPLQIGVPTYYASILGFSTPAGATDVACLEGAAGKVVKLAGAFLSGTVESGTASILNVLSLRRVTLNAGGTSATILTASGNPTHKPPLAKLRVWSVSPTTLGTPDPAGSTFRALRWDISSVLSSPDTSPMISAQVNNPYTSQPEIRNAAHAICLSYQAETVPATKINLNLVWTETDS